MSRVCIWCWQGDEGMHVLTPCADGQAVHNFKPVAEVWAERFEKEVEMTEYREEVQIVKAVYPDGRARYARFPVLPCTIAWTPQWAHDRGLLQWTNARADEGATIFLGEAWMPFPDPRRPLL